MKNSGFPHSEISGSMRICRSPKLIAACHVLLRLLMPRHSPCALISLTYVFLLIPVTQIFLYISTHFLNMSFPHVCLWSALFSFQCASYINIKVNVVGLSGLEPPTSRLSGVRSNRLSYKPSSTFPFRVVEMRRIELLTPCLQGRCSPS